MKVGCEWYAGLGERAGGRRLHGYKSRPPASAPPPTLPPPQLPALTRAALRPQVGQLEVGCELCLALAAAAPPQLLQRAQAAGLQAVRGEGAAACRGVKGVVVGGAERW